MPKGFEEIACPTAPRFQNDNHLEERIPGHERVGGILGGNRVAQDIKVLLESGNDCQAVEQ